MNKIHFFEKFIILEKLIRQGCTGTPDEFARRLSISRSTLYELIDELKSYGVEIKYSRRKNSFYYSGNSIIEVYFGIKEMTESELRDTSGGGYIFFVPSIFSDGMPVFLSA